MVAAWPLEWKSRGPFTEHLDKHDLRDCVSGRSNDQQPVETSVIDHDVQDFDPQGCVLGHPRVGRAEAPCASRPANLRAALVSAVDTGSAQRRDQVDGILTPRRLQ